MPNHETNNVLVTGDPAQVAAFVEEAFTDGRIDFEKIVPPPENIETGGCPHLGIDPNLGADGTYTDDEGNTRTCWYKWNLANWGTKWGAYEHRPYKYTVRKLWNAQTGMHDRPWAFVFLVFETAWSQPTPIFDAIEEKWGVKVLAVTQDEGGYPDVYYGDRYEVEEYLTPTTEWVFYAPGLEADDDTGD